jgi:C4-dicarboxylate transporter, DctM subunit
MAALLIVEIVFRPLSGFGIIGSFEYVRQLTLWVALLGGALATREGRMLALATGTFLPEGTVRRRAAIFAGAVGAAVSGALAWGAVELVLGERAFGGHVAGTIPTWIAQLVLPVGFGLIAVRRAWRAPGRVGRLTAGGGLALGLLLAAGAERLEGLPVWPLVVLILVAAALGAPIFTVLGGLAVVLFLADGLGPITVLIQTYDLATNPTLPAVPLFTLAGFLLAEGSTPARLLRVFRALVGWMPGGTAVVCVIVSAFFTIFTGGSGVTILALGGLLLPALLADGYRDRFSVGLLTASGSLGLLLPPALPLILYAIVAELPPEDLFVGGILPGLLLIGLVAAWGMREGFRLHTARTPVTSREAAAAVWDAKWELLLPIVIVGAFLGGYATIVETSALAVLYAFVVQVLLRREVRVGRDLGRVLTDCTMTIGGVLVILTVAVGFTYYLVAADVPARLIDWTQQVVTSPLVFLLALNVFLLLVGCVMDIFSATFVVVPLIVPLGLAYGIHPVHLGIIFIANLELGYMTPPVGLNLFLASYRFKRPLLEVYRAALPMLVILGIGVLIITYVPWLSLALLEWTGRR